MSTGDRLVLEAEVEHAERVREEASAAERAAFEAWQEALGAYEVARDESAVVWRAYVDAVA